MKAAIEQGIAVFPFPDYQWIEDRFWTWIHYALLKIGRGEYVEAFDFFAFLRSVVLGPLLHIKHGNLPRGVRKVETLISADDLEKLVATLPTYSRDGLLQALKKSITLYRELRKELYTPEILCRTATENRVIKYLETIEE